MDTQGILKILVPAIATVVAASIGAWAILRSKKKEPSQGISSPGIQKEPDTDKIELLYQYVNKTNKWLTPEEIADQAPQLVDYQELKSVSVEEIRIMLDALATRKKIIRQEESGGSVRYMFYD